MNSNFQKLAIWVAILVLLAALFNLFNNPAQSRRGDEITYSEFLTAVEAGKVADATIAGNRISGTMKDAGGAFQTYAPEDPGLVERLRAKDVNFKVAPRDEDVPSIMSVLLNWFPMLLLIAVWIFFMRQMQSGSGRAMGFGKSRAKLLTERHGRVTFDDVAGVDEAKTDLQEIVEFLRDPQKFQRLGGRIPRGCLLVGPPGTGKTLIARAVAGEANVPFFTISGSDFVEMFVGVGASRVRDMFEQAKKNAPCIIFIDEIDAVGRHRGAGLGGGNDEREQTLNQLLVEMDGFEANEGVIIIAATNRPDVLDPALLRPGRFDRQIIVPNPDVLGREKILRVHMRKVPIAPDVDARVIARGTPGFSGADLANLVNEAALLAARRNKRLVTQSEFEDSKDKVMMGAERRSMAMTEEEKLATAYHEAGHALVNLLVPGNDPLHKVTIIPRGRALGVTMSLPERDKLSYSKEWCEGKIAMAFGGRVAEQLVYGKDHLNTGASSDITQATNIAKRMVTEWGMSEKLGPLLYNENQQEVFLGHSITQQQNMSEETAKVIDEETRRIIMEGYNKAWEVLSANRDKLEAITQALMEYETISGAEVDALLRGEKIVRRTDDEGSEGGSAGSAVPTAGRAVRPRQEPDPDTGGMEPQPG
ncbi:protease, ATP-dependent zinc-metallo [Candidatus Filomicrobium marinum]|uniref:ATP-dependent zinc metalloprotease FtsH n=2 Tax=Filomicrobium TaxID=119044 RepID=A0A0D6J9Z9_9HYPH|nr:MULTISPECIES: ATP-dependent zinc metalloprotease FtsH [Filomicrobium]MCV0368680.1 ATP-dependent zinc metalloprotease FtsH [Filomicrobium sp.]CFX00199.1 protease, ATP-dependent zinc-metallo [Candidatus Filomicrobium marinum]CPR15188.1 protease, ATP-dependent zinc-metallo [Candidatus Filomicrobium marinum]SDO69500.1 membrane protease FtsH catalytic subunit [Filomicrobium insigne]